MASKGRVPSPHFRRPLPGPGVVHHDPYGMPIRPPPVGFPPFETLPHPEVMEQKLSAQHLEIEKLVKENLRLAGTHETLRRDLATVNNELQLVQAHIANMTSEREQQTRGILEKMSMMEAELGGADAIKMELQQARAEAQSLVSTRQELINKVQQLTRDLQMAHSDAQQIPSLMSELDSLRQEYQHSRATYDYEKKLYGDHLESLQVMENNYMTMSREVDKLRAELTNFANVDPRAGGPYGGYPGYGESFNMGNYASGQNPYAPAQQGQVPPLGGGSAAGASGTGTGIPTGAEGNSPHIVAQSAPAASGAAPDASKAPVYSASTGTGYDPHRGQVGAGYDTQKGHTAGHDAHRVPTGSNYDYQRGQTGPGYDPQRGPSGPSYDHLRRPTAPMGPGYDVHRGPGGAYEAQRGYRPEIQRGPVYDAHRGPVYQGQTAPAYDMQRGPGNDVQRGGSHDIQIAGVYDTSSNRGSVGPQGQGLAKNAPYAPTNSCTGAASGHVSVPQGGNPVHR